MQIKEFLAIDIETMADEEMISCLPEVEPNKTLKDVEKIAINIANKKQEQIQDMAINPLYGKIACISLYNDNIKKVLIGDEKTILQEFFSIINDYILITFNGINFDIPFIFKRGFKYDLCSLKQMKQYTNKYSDFCHIDLMNEFCNFGKLEKLNTLTKIYLGKEKIEFDVKLISEMIKTEEGRNKLIEYNLHDSELTYELAKKFKIIN